MDQDQHYLLPLMIGTTAIFLFGTFLLTAIGNALRQIYKKETKKDSGSLSRFFFYRFFHLYFFPKKEFESLFFATTCTLNVTRFCYAAAFVASLSLTYLSPLKLMTAHSPIFLWGLAILVILLFVGFAFLIGDFIPRLLGTRYPEFAIKACGPLASLFMFLAFPITYLFLKASLSVGELVHLEEQSELSAQVQQEIMEIIQDVKESSSGLDAHEKKLIESVVSFRDRIAREVMVPRVDLFCLPAETSIEEAAKLLLEEGYSRVPVYKKNVDHIIGVLMYKDILKKYMDYEFHGKDSKILEAPIESIIKNVLYTPETKKISNLLQEFRKKQVHLAIVVDEYGGTEGIVTIEDILEEIVGEIADEYDEKEALYLPLPEGGWLVDARMSILDVDELLGIQLPQEGDYDTLGGYIFHRTGSIPPKGMIIHHDTFDLEIVLSNDRLVEQVKITPRV